MWGKAWVTSGDLGAIWDRGHLGGAIRGHFRGEVGRELGGTWGIRGPIREQLEGATWGRRLWWAMFWGTILFGGLFLGGS